MSPAKMTAEPASTNEPAWAETPARRPRRVTVALSGAALVGAVAAALAIPSTGYLARAHVSVAGSASTPAAGGGDAFVPNPVISRAAASLIGAGIEVPPPDTFERIGVALGIAGARATGEEARLAEDIARTARFRTDERSGALSIEAVAPEAAAATRIATALAFAFVADQDDIALKSRRQQEMAASADVDRLKVETASARRRLVELGGTEADPAQMRATSAAQLAAAQARVDAIRGIVASGTPPLGDRRDVPAAIETLQASYLDLSRQLAKASETLGDRHTTIISLREGFRHAAAALTAEWKRLQRVAEADLETARARDTALRKAPADAKRHDAAADARRQVLALDAALVRAQDAARGIGLPTATLSARPALSAMPIGYGLPVRGSIAALVAMLIFGLGRAFPTMVAAVKTARRTPAAAIPDMIATPRAIDLPLEKAAPVPPARNECLTRAMAGLLRHAGPLPAQFGGVPTLMVAAGDDDLDTTPAALALGRAAARDGRRVLVIEAGRHGTLADAADEARDPILVDLYGTLGIALRAGGDDGMLYLAPRRDRGAARAGALARRGETPIVDDLAAEFELIVIDGGDARTCARDGWGADAYIRVGRDGSRRADANLLALFDDRQGRVLGRVDEDGVLSPTEVAPPVREAAPRSTARAPGAARRPQLHVVADRRQRAPRRSA